MIVPIVDEAVWRKSFAHLPPFNIAARQIVFISPHPDDETLGAGAFLAAEKARGTEIIVAAVTDGENAYQDNDSLAKIRCEEQAAALSRLGFRSGEIHRFGLTDSGVEQEKQKLVRYLLPLVTKESCLFAPWVGDFHPDHEACGWAAHQVAQQSGASLYWYFFWTWHRGTVATLQDLDLRAFRFDDSLLEMKLSALACHRSQLYREGEEPILPDRLLGPARRNFEVFARA